MKTYTRKDNAERAAVRFLKRHCFQRAGYSVQQLADGRFAFSVGENGFVPGFALREAYDREVRGGSGDHNAPTRADWTPPPAILSPAGEDRFARLVETSEAEGWDDPAPAPSPAPEPTPEPSTRPAKGPRPGSKMALMVELVCRPEGATYQQLLDATEWKQCRPMLKKACAAAGVALRMVRDGSGPGTYFGQRSELARTTS